MKNIYLVGFMGTGKTETAKLLARRLKRVFMDMDDVITDREKMPITAIFKVHGEPYFRKIENELAVELSLQDGLVVACGGGAFANQENIDVFKKSGTVVCLTSSPEVIIRRTSRFNCRPLLDVPDPQARVEELLKKREPFYAQAHLTIDVDKLSVPEAAEVILGRLNLI